MLTPLTSLAGIALLAIVSQLVALRARLPAILFLLLAGITVGPLLGWLNPDALFGDLLFPLVSLSVSVILFEGALTLRFSELKGIGRPVRNLVTLGALITLVITALATWYFVGLEPKLALLFGAVVVVTGPTVIVPMLRTVRPNARVANVLRWEGIIIDPLGALLAVLAFNFYISSQSASAYTDILILFGEMILAGTVLGLGAGFLLGEVLRRFLIADFLRPAVTLLSVFVVFAVSETIHHESGLLAVTIFGMTLANMDDVEIEDILDFKESLSIVLISGLFILLAARIEIDAILATGMGAILVLLTIMLIARPLAVAASTLGSELTWRERALIAWIGPRGIVCAAVAAVFALRLEESGVAAASLFVPLAFMVIIGTVVIQALTAKQIAALLDVRDPAPVGVLIVGGNMVARSIASALKAQDIKVVIADSNYEHIREARMLGITTFFGNPVSERADRDLDLSGLGKLFAMSARSHLDDLAGLNFRGVFGANNIFEMPLTVDGRNEKRRLSRRFRGKHLFAEDVNFSRLAAWLRGGAEIRATLLTPEFGLADYLTANQDNLIRLFAIDTNGRLRIYTDDDNFTPEAGWKMISLIREPDPVGEAA